MRPITSGLKPAGLTLSLAFLLGQALSLGISPAAMAAPGEPIGAAIAIKNDVTASYERERRKLAKDDPVRQEEVIEVGQDSLGELKFKDDTKLALGPGARMTLDKFVYDPEKTNGSIIVNLIKGTFRFITGLAAKPTYEIKTPAASISVRGTIFDVYIQDDGEVWLLLIEGAVEVCAQGGGNCRVLDEPGKFIRVSKTPRTKRAGSGPWIASPPVKWAALPERSRRSVPLETAMPFVAAAPSFDPDPGFSAGDILVGRWPRPHRPHRPDGGRPDGGGKDTGGKDGGGKNTGSKDGGYPGTTGTPPSRGDGGGKGGGKDGGKGTTKPPVYKDPVIRHPRRPHVEDPPKIRKPRVERPKIEKPRYERPRIEKSLENIRKHSRRSEGDGPVIRHRPEHNTKVQPRVSVPFKPHIGGGGGGIRVR